MVLVPPPRMHLTRFHGVFAPHSPLRAAPESLTEADIVVLTEIYASGTAPIPGITGKLLVNAVLDAHPRTQMVWMPKRDDLVAYLSRQLRDGDVCISMGCGDIASFPAEVLSRRTELDTRSTR